MERTMKEGEFDRTWDGEEDLFRTRTEDIG